VQVFQPVNGLIRWLVKRQHIERFVCRVSEAVTRQRQLSTAAQQPTEYSRHIHTSTMLLVDIIYSSSSSSSSIQQYTAAATCKLYSRVF